jgi:tetratricopeptide (TPR) repeat protein
MKTSSIPQGKILLKKRFKKTFLLFFFLGGLFFTHLNAQNINGFKIYVAADTTSQLHFHSKVETWQFDEESGISTYEVALADDYSIKIMAKKATAETLHLNVTEGKRKHKFLLFYKEGVNGLQINHDYSDLNKLEEFVKKGTDENLPDPKIVTLVSEADKYFFAQQYEPAQAKYRDVLKFDSANEYAKKQLVQIDNKINEKKKADQKIVDDRYNAAILKANNALSSKNYAKAENGYNEALTIKPGDIYSQNQFAVIEKEKEKNKLEEENHKKEDLYKNYISTGDKAFNAKLYEAAKNAYSQALNVKPGDAIAASRLDELEKQMASALQQEEIRKSDSLYKSYILSADKILLEQSFEEAKIIYTQALSVKPGDKYCNDQLRKIDETLEKQVEIKQQDEKNKALEDQYNTVITLADSAFDKEMWDVAKEQYAAAFKIINKPYPQQRINEMNRKLNDLKKLQDAERQKQEKDSLDILRFNALIKKADNDFENKAFESAKNGYKQALNIKDDQSAKDKLTETQNILTEISMRNKEEKDSIAKQNEINKKYNAVMAKAKIAYANNDYINAQAGFQEACELKPDDAEPKSMIEEVNKKLTELVEAKTIQDKYDSVVAKAELALGNNEYDSALEGYKYALQIKPDEQYYLQKQINYLQIQLAKKDSIVFEQRRVEDRRKKFNDGMNAYNNGRTALRDLRYEDALSEFKKFLDLIPDTSELNTNQYNQQELINFAKAKVQDLNEYLARTKAKDTTKNISNKTPSNLDTSKQKSGGSFLYHRILKKHLKPNYPYWEGTEEKIDYLNGNELCDNKIQIAFEYFDTQRVNFELLCSCI